MTKKTIYFLTVFILEFAFAHSQALLSKAQFINILKVVRAQDSSYITQPNVLVSDYTFRNMVKNDFLTLTGIGNSATVNQYASLNVQPGNTQLTFSPYVSYGKDLAEHPFLDVISVNASASVDATTNLFNFQNWRTLNGSFTWMHLFNRLTAYSHQPITIKDNINLYKNLYERFAEAYDNAADNNLLRLSHPEFTDPLKLKKAYMDSISKYEQLLTAGSWTSKHYNFLKLTANVFSFDNANYVVTGDTNTYNNPKSKGIWTPSVNISYNYFLGLSNGWNFYSNIYTQVGLKDEFTEVYTASTYNSFHPLTDTSLVQKQIEQIFQTSSDNIGARLLPNFGAEGVIFFPVKSKASYGIDIIYAHDDIISNKSFSLNGYLATTTLGLIITLADKSGLPTVNLEPYFQYNSYFNETIPNNHIWGAKFTVPINRVF